MAPGYDLDSNATNLDSLATRMLVIALYMAHGKNVGQHALIFYDLP